MSKDHYVSQFYLRQFETHRRGNNQKRHDIYICNTRLADKPRLKPILRVLCEENLFRIMEDNGRLDNGLENWLASIESKAGISMKKLIEERQGEDTLTNDEWVCLLRFMRIQFNRSRYLEIQKRLSELDGLSEQQRKEMFIDLIGTSGSGDVPGYDSFEKHFARKEKMRVAIESTDRSFVTSDNPVSVKDGIGFGHEHSVTVFPISSGRLLIFSSASYLPKKDKINTDIGGFVSAVNRIMAINAKRYIVGRDNEELIVATSPTKVRVFEDFC